MKTIISLGLLSLISTSFVLLGMVFLLGELNNFNPLLFVLVKIAGIIFILLGIRCYGCLYNVYKKNKLK